MFMKSFLYLFFGTLSFLMGAATSNAQKLVTFPDIPGRTPSDKYICRVRQIDSDEWKSAFVLQTISKPEIRENGVNLTGYKDILLNWTASWIAFEFSGTPVEVEISKVGGAPIVKAMVRPVGHASAASIIDGRVYVTFEKPANVNVDIDGQMEDTYTGMGYAGPPVHTISIFANPLYNVPDTTRSKVIALNPGEKIPDDINTWDTVFFKPGVHYIGTPFTIYSNKVLYIPGNAVVHGTIHPPDKWGSDAASNWTVYGSGALSSEEVARAPGEKWNKPFTYQASRVRLEGFVVVDPAHHTFNMNNNTEDSKNVNVYKNLKILGWRVNGDGLNAFRNSEITDCFFRCQDDHFYYGGDNVRISNCVCWSDYNGAVLYVTKGAKIMESSYFKDIKVIYHRAGWHYWEGGRVISFRDRKPGNVIKNVQIRNVLVEDPFPAFPPFYFKMLNPENSDATMDYNNIIIENVKQEHAGVTGSGDSNYGKPENTMLGLDESRKFRNITFKNCYYDGKWLGSFDDGDFSINSYVVDINFVLNRTIQPENFILSTQAKNGGIVVYPSDDTPGDVTLTATPIAGYQFDSWSGDLSGSKNPVTITMNNNKTIIANFSSLKPQCKLSVVAANGVVSFDPVTENGLYPQGTEVTITATGNLSYSFDTWGGDLSGTANPAKVVMLSDKMISAVFSVKSVSSIRIDECPAKILKTGELHQLSAIVSPSDAYDKSVKWSSSNKDVASVDENGLVSAISQGSVTIYVETNNGGLIKSCIMGIVTSGFSVTGVTLTGCSSANLMVDSSYQFRALVSPANAGDLRVSWSSTDTTVAMVNENGLVTAVSEGIAIIAATTSEGGFTDKCAVSVGNENSIGKFDNSVRDVEVFPNPASEMLYFKFPEAVSEKKICFYNTLGNLLYTKTLNDELSEIDITQFSAEKMLIVKVITSKAAVSIKIIL